jgi:hypothetical protein
MSFDKNALLAALKPKTKPVQVEGFGPVQARQLSVAEVTAIRAKLKNDDANDAFGLNLVVMSFIDDDGAPIFTDGDMQELESSSNSAMEALVTVALELNGFKKAAEAKN